VSSCEWYYFLRVLTLRSKFRELNDSIDGCALFLKPILPYVVKPLSLRPAFPCASLISLLEQCPPFRLSSSTHAHRFVFVVLPLVVDKLPPVLFINLAIDSR
jgi:hypothetical protein